MQDGNSAQLVMTTRKGKKKNVKFMCIYYQIRIHRRNAQILKALK